MTAPTIEDRMGHITTRRPFATMAALLALVATFDWLADAIARLV